MSNILLEYWTTAFDKLQNFRIVILLRHEFQCEFLTKDVFIFVQVNLFFRSQRRFCSFPFTYLGQLFYQCKQILYDGASLCESFACMMSGRKWVGCVQPDEGLPQFTFVSNNIIHVVVDSVNSRLCVLGDHISGGGGGKLNAFF